jgi:hypothetical protein
MNTFNHFKCSAVAIMLGAAVLAGGCSAGDVELNGSVFDYLGVGSNSKSGSRDVKTSERQGLVLPPNLERLPEPGSGVAALQGGDVMPVDPEQRRMAGANQARANHASYCEKALQKARIMKDLSPVNGPLGRCDASILDSLTVNSPVEVKTGSTTPTTGLPR